MPAILLKRPVAFRVKDHADGWLLCQDEEVANREAEKMGEALVQGLYVRDGSAIAVEGQPLIDALRKLVVAARTAGGVAGRDEALCAACDHAEAQYRDYCDHVNNRVGQEILVEIVGKVIDPEAWGLAPTIEIAEGYHDRNTARAKAKLIIEILK